jgi:hypothetical protein
VLAAAEKPNAPQAIKELPAKVKRGEMKVALFVICTIVVFALPHKVRDGDLKFIS